MFESGWMWLASRLPDSFHQLLRAGTTDFSDAHPSVQVPESVFRQEGITEFKHLPQPPIPVGLGTLGLQQTPRFPSWFHCAWWAVPWRGGGSASVQSWSLREGQASPAPERASVWLLTPYPERLNSSAAQAEVHLSPGSPGLLPPLRVGTYGHQGPEGALGADPLSVAGHCLTPVPRAGPSWTHPHLLSPKKCPM